MIKKPILFSLIVGLLLAAVSFYPARPVKAQSAGLVSSILNRLEKNRQSLKTLRANISMEKYNAQIRDRDIYQGVILYIPGPGGSRSAFVRLEWTKPQQEILAVANGNYTLFRPRLKMAWVGKTGSIRSQKDNDVLDLLNMSSAQLQARFGEFQDVREETLWGGVWTQHFKVVPKGAASYQFIEVWIDKEGMPVQTKMVEKNDDATTVRLTNVEKNQTIPMDQFNLKLDSSVKKVKG